MAMDDPRAFTYSLDLLIEAAKLYMRDGKIPSEEETLYRATDWESQVLLCYENFEWAKNQLKG